MNSKEIHDLLQGLINTDMNDDACGARIIATSQALMAVVAYENSTPDVTKGTDVEGDAIASKSCIKTAYFNSLLNVRDIALQILSRYEHAPLNGNFAQYMKELREAIAATCQANVMPPDELEDDDLSDDDNVLVAVDLYQPSGKWKYGGEVPIRRMGLSSRSVKSLYEEIERNQKFVLPGTMAVYVVTVRNTDINDPFIQIMIPMGEVRQ